MAYSTKRQTIITHSTCASEYVAASDTISFLELMEDQLKMFDPPPVPGTSESEILYPIFVDNESAIRVARNTVVNSASKHLKLRHIEVTEKQKQLLFVGTKHQEADAFTKSLGEEIYSMMVLTEMGEGFAIT